MVGAESNFTQTVNQFKASVSTTYATKAALAATNEELALQTETIEKYLTFGDDYLVIGTSANKFNVQITNEAINFRNGEQVLAYMTNQKLYIAESQVTTSQQIGSYMWMLPDQNGAVA